jgi:hypothetical protein
VPERDEPRAADVVEQRHAFSDAAVFMPGGTFERQRF